jgi:hypothetical protein
MILMFDMVSENDFVNVEMLSFFTRLYHVVVFQLHTGHVRLTYKP